MYLARADKCVYIFLIFMNLTLCLTSRYSSEDRATLIDHNVNMIIDNPIIIRVSIQSGVGLLQADSTAGNLAINTHCLRLPFICLYTAEGTCTSTLIIIVLNVYIYCLTLNTTSIYPACFTFTY